MTGNEPQERLLVALAEELKLPLLQIARGAELAEMQGSQSSSSALHIAQSALQLIDSYILGLTPGQHSLALEPVSLSAVVTDLAHELTPFAKQYQCEVRVNLGGRYGPVMANRQSLYAALSSLAYSFIGSNAETKMSSITMGVHKSPQGIVAGIFAPDVSLTSDLFKRAKALYGTARQPMVKSSSASSAGVFIADLLLQNMAATLRVAHHQKMTGLATTLLPSQQLRLGVA